MRVGRGDCVPGRKSLFRRFLVLHAGSTRKPAGADSIMPSQSGCCCTWDAEVGKELQPSSLPRYLDTYWVYPDTQVPRYLSVIEAAGVGPVSADWVPRPLSGPCARWSKIPPACCCQPASFCDDLAQLQLHRPVSALRTCTETSSASISQARCKFEVESCRIESTTL